MTATVVIPARFGSTRFPAKILARQTGQPLVQHVVDRVRQCARVRECIVATDDVRIVEALRPYGTKVVMTSAEHQSGTDRIAEVAKGLSDNVIVNVQGDEPEITAEAIDRLIELMQADSGVMMATVVAPFPVEQDVANPNLVKCVVTATGRAQYFSRSPVPYYRDADARVSRAYYLHLGIYAYRREFLAQYTAWAPTPLERAEKLEQLRALEMGTAISVLKIDHALHGIDTAEQYASFVERFNLRRAVSSQ